MKLLLLLLIGLSHDAIREQNGWLAAPARNRLNEARFFFSFRTNQGQKRNPISQLWKKIIRFLGILKWYVSPYFQIYVFGHIKLYP
jgi:hypothetical protein